ASGTWSARPTRAAPAPGARPARGRRAPAPPAPDRRRLAFQLYAPLPMPSAVKNATGLTPNTFLLALSSLFADVSTEMLYPVLPIFLTQTLGASASIVGIVEGIATATQNIVQ